MKAVRFHQTGGPDVLVYEEVPDLTPADDEVLIRVEAAGVNFTDIMRRRGDDYPEPSPAPFTLGATKRRLAPHPDPHYRRRHRLARVM